MQHLNLYSQLDRAVEPPFSARQQLLLVAVVSVVMVAVAMGLAVAKGVDASAQKKLVVEQQAVEYELNSLKAKKANLENNPALDSEIVSLMSEVKFRRRLLDTIDPEKNVLEKGFSDHFAGLARQHIDGLWFTEIQLRKGGGELALMGRTRAPEYVPQFLQKLAKEEVFAGHHFRVLRMSVPAERKDLLDFELRAQEVDQLR